MKKLLENFQRKWPTYLFEVIVLIVGIYGAFALENWRDSRQEREEANNLLKNLQSDFAFNQQFLEGNIQGTELTISSGLRILKFFEDYQVPNQDLTDSLIFNVLYVSNYSPTQAALLDMINTGNSRLIKDDSLRNLLLSFPGKVQQIKQMEVRSNDLLRNGMFNYLFEHFSFARMDARLNSFEVDWHKRGFESDLELIFNDRKFESMVDDHVWRSLEMVQSQKTLLSDIVRIRILLEQTKERK